MTPLLLAQLISGILTYAPQMIGLVVKLKEDIEAGRTQTTVSTADVVELDRLCGLTGFSIYARLGITPPPPRAAIPVAPTA